MESNLKLAFLPSDLRIYICDHAAQGHEVVRAVIWDKDGDIQMFCGRVHDFSPDGKDGRKVRIAGIGHLLERQSDLADLSLCKGEEAWREDSGEWSILPFVQEDNEGE